MMYKYAVLIMVMIMVNSHDIKAEILHKLSYSTNQHHLQDSQLKNQNQNIAKQVYQALLVLLQQQVPPSRSLCQQSKLTQCGNYCCQKEGKIQYHNRQFVSTEHILSQLCLSSDRAVCGQVCCKSGLCERNTRNQHQKSQGEHFNLRYAEYVCKQDQSVIKQEQCKNAGLLWCDGDCCGFSAEKHKCYKTNHYGSTYIRCPIEDPIV